MNPARRKYILLWAVLLFSIEFYFLLQLFSQSDAEDREVSVTNDVPSLLMDDVDALSSARAIQSRDSGRKLKRPMAKGRFELRLIILRPVMRTGMT